MAINQLEDFDFAKSPQAIQQSSTPGTKKKRKLSASSATLLATTITYPQMEQTNCDMGGESQNVICEESLIPAAEVLPQDNLQNLLSSSPESAVYTAITPVVEISNAPPMSITHETNTNIYQ